MGRMAEHYEEVRAEIEDAACRQEQEKQMSDTTTLAEALLAAQSEMKNPQFDTTNPHFKSRFASLAAVRAAVLPALNRHGIVLVQDLATTERGVACRTVLIKGGESMVFGPLEIPATKNDAQGFGSAATYARRYALQTAVCVVGDDDDDANAASGKLDPLDRANLKTDARHEAYAVAFREALNGGDVVAVHDDCQTEGEEFYRAVWGLLESKDRAAIKRTIKERPE